MDSHLENKQSRSLWHRLPVIPQYPFFFMIMNRHFTQKEIVGNLNIQVAAQSYNKRNTN